MSSPSSRTELSTAEPGSHVTPARARRVAIAGAIGTFVEYYDFTAYGLMAVTLSAVFFPTQDQTAALLSTLAVFAAAFVLRPLGGIVMGHLGDRYGRKPVLAWAVIGMAVSSSLIGLLPGYATAGVAATVALVLLRALQGLSAGGEIGGAATYVAEWSPDGRRGLLCSSTQLGNLLGVLFGSVLIAVLNVTMTSDAMQAWGWRIPFLISLPLGLIGLYVRRRLDETPEFERLRQQSAVPVKQRSPVLTAILHNWRGVARVGGFSVGSFAAYYVVYVYGSTFLEQEAGLSATAASWCSTGTLALAAATVMLWGGLSDRVGRKPVLLGAFLAMALFAYPSFALMSSGSTVLGFAGLALLGLCEAAVMGTILSTYTELFGTRSRFTGFSLGYNLGSILTGGTAPYIATWLIGTTGDARAPGIFLVVAALVSVGTALTLRETAQRPLTKD
ncbi:MFS transporter [Saccharopolyspora sp. K220]|uniref:MFS transporter n=1 Tax=Saccharopolyspora soli TaxID=2926618 RepID=UPI001F588DB3|nr:MFS transporter [Saccharopolyspora soli]MCI2424373.1 MFS transporter [Saccharopolyspora soli]